MPKPPKAATLVEMWWRLRTWLLLRLATMAMSTTITILIVTTDTRSSTHFLFHTTSMTTSIKRSMDSNTATRMTATHTMFIRMGTSTDMHTIPHCLR